MATDALIQILAKYKKVLDDLSTQFNFVLFNLPVYITYESVGSDVDIVVPSKDYSDVCNYFLKNGFIPHIRHINSHQTAFSKYIKAENKYLMFHIHADVSFMGIKFFDFQTIYDQSELMANTGYRYVSLYHDASICLLEFFLKKKLKAKSKVAKFLDQDCFEEKNLIKPIEFVLKFYNKGLTPSVASQLNFYFLYGSSVMPLIAYCHRAIFSRFGFLDVKRHGKLVFFIGLDGSGKTTLINSTMLALQTGFMPIRYRYMGSKVTLLQRFMTLRAGSANRTFGYSSISKAHNRPIIFRWLLCFYYIFEYLIRSFGDMIFLRSQNNLVLYDRGFYDKLLNPDRSLDDLYFSLLPKPDLVVFLTGDPEVLWERKKEFSLPKFQQMASSYGKLVSFLGRKKIRVLSVDTTTKSPEEATDMIVKEIDNIFFDYDLEFYLKYFKD